MTASSLIAPFDAIRFALAYAILVMAPGYAIAALARPRSDRIERLALAVPCSYTLVAISGLATALLHLSFALPSYAALALPLTLVGVITSRRRDEQLCERAGWRFVPVGVAVAQVVTIMAVFAGYVAQPNSDAIKHILWTSRIARAHVFPIALLSSPSGTTDGGFYPPAFHALGALLLQIAPMAPYRAVFFNAVAATAFLPLALFVYVRAATGSARLGGLAAFASLAFEPIPLFVSIQGLYTLTVSQLFVPAIALALRDGLLRGDRRATALAAALGVGLFYTHPTEFVTAGLLFLAIVSVPRDVRSWRRAAGHGAIVAAAWAISAIPALAAVHQTMIDGARPEIRNSHYFVPASHIHLNVVLSGYLQGVYGRNVGYGLLALVVIGGVWCLARRRWLGIVAAQAVLFALYIDTTSYDLLQRFYVLSFPWALWERLAATHYWFALPLAAIGTDAVARGARQLMRAKSRVFVGLLAAPFVLLGLLLPFGVASERAAGFINAHMVIAPSDLGALAWLARHAPSASIVVNDSNLTHRVIYDAPTDAGAWMPVMNGPYPLFWEGESGPGSLDDRDYLAQHIAAASLPPRAMRFVIAHNVRFVFYGAGLRPTATRHLNLGRLLADPQLRLVYSSAEGCRDTTDRAMAMCPATASYVFALHVANYPTRVVAQISHVLPLGHRLPS